MRIDVDTVVASFSAAVHGAVLATLDFSGDEYAAVGIIISSTGGTLTTASVDLIPTDSLAGTVVFSGGDIFCTTNFTGTGKFMISRVGAFNVSKASATALGEGFLLPPPLKYAQIVADIQGGGNITGSVTVFRYTR